ncbi:MAG: hypothetical protein A2W25_05065 [candidate division Zixibacteria bacterium RBG_16_53_22]|nr:MAG: hypothetical protein A2W25_05065 [candidate division Zixibacteria bacterium RBG_16_53_22]
MQLGNGQIGNMAGHTKLILRVFPIHMQGCRKSEILQIIRFTKIGYELGRRTGTNQERQRLKLPMVNSILFIFFMHLQKKKRPLKNTWAFILILRMMAKLVGVPSNE